MQLLHGITINLQTVNISNVPTRIIPGNNYQFIKSTFTAWTAKGQFYRLHLGFEVPSRVRAGDSGRCRCMGVVQGHKAHLAMRGMSSCSNRPLLCREP